MENKKHKEIVDNYEKTKSNHLEKLATKMLKIDERNEKLREKSINIDIFKLFKK